MQILKNKTMTILVALILVTSISTSTMFLPSAKANNPPWTIVSYAYLSVSPNPIGVGQTADVCMWVDAPLPGAAIENDIRRHDYTLTITSPDGKIESKHWDVVSDTTGVQFYQYVPDQIGKYTFSFNYPQQSTHGAAPTKTIPS